MDRKKNEARWTALVAAWEKSGLSQREFCRRRGISISGFSYWRGKLEGGSRRKRALVRVGQVAVRPVQEQNGLRVRVGERLVVEGCDGVDAEALERVLRVVVRL